MKLIEQSKPLPDKYCFLLVSLVHLVSLVYLVSLGDKPEKQIKSDKPSLSLLPFPRKAG